MWAEPVRWPNPGGRLWLQRAVNELPISAALPDIAALDQAGVVVLIAPPPNGSPSCCRRGRPGGEGVARSAAAPARRDAPWSEVPHRDQGRAGRDATLLIRAAFAETAPAMPARIFQRPKSAMQSGKARVGAWVLEFVPAEAKRADPLMGWAGSGDMNQQVQLVFPDEGAAIDYAARHGIEARVHPAPVRRLKLQAYADNFR